MKQHISFNPLNTEIIMKYNLRFSSYRAINEHSLLYREIIAALRSILAHTLCGQNVKFLDVKPGGTLGNYWA